MKFPSLTQLNQMWTGFFAMLGYEMVCLATALDSDAQRISLLERHSFKRTDGFDVLYSRSLRDPVSLPKLDPSIRLRHATERA